MAVIIEPNLDLLYAAMNGSLRGVKEALKAGADIDFDIKNSETFSPGTALYIASYKGHVDIVKLLLRKGASVSKRTRSSFAPLHGAATEGSIPGVETTKTLRESRNSLLAPGIRLQAGQFTTQHHHHCTQRYYKPGTEIGKGENEESLKLVEEARKSKLLRCCNPTCGKPGYRSTGTLKLCGRCKLTRYCSRDCQKQHWYYKEGTEIGKGDNEESWKIIEEARKLLRCCNPKCGKPDHRKTLKLCGRCKLTRYCSRDCQKQHWSVGHKKCCGHDVYL
uniref:MYND-type domain-containing protein n=1 Tax=Branchiostoma floridae TaxID=7739 RepID=C3YSE4_BRAFL|eukprot:XP_002601037.1 hypothetical protein BRAFLDRAFT_96927 [Branchiostoma floridae]